MSGGNLRDVSRDVVDADNGTSDWVTLAVCAFTAGNEMPVAVAPIYTGQKVFLRKDQKFGPPPCAQTAPLVTAGPRLQT